MRFLVAGALATLTAAGLAAIRTPVLTDDERTAAAAIREGQMRADIRFLSSDLVEDGTPAGPRDALARAYITARLEAVGLEPGAPGGTWEQPVELVGVTATANVIGLLRGRDPELAREVVLYTARHDRCSPRRGPSRNPVVDDGTPGTASGVAALLAIAEAYAALPVRPRRSILFAAVGDRPGPHLAWPLPVPAGTLAASIDLDGLSVRRRTRDVPVIGLGRSSLDDWVRAVAAAQGREVVPAAFPDEGGDDRSDVLSFARSGVPEHRPAEWTADRDLSGAVEDARLLFHVGVKVADAPLAPTSRRGGEIEAAGKPAAPGALR